MESTVINHSLSLDKFLEIYTQDGFINTVANRLKSRNQGTFHLKGLAGSLDAVVAASIYRVNRQTQLFVMRDKEEAAYFFNDMQNLLPGKEILMLPASYKKAYQFEETENANVLMRAEILNKVNQRALEGEIVVTYPEALTEKVINKQSLQKNTFAATVGDQIDLEFFNELLITYDFEKSDFVYEAGQFSIRGGIVDIFSYGNDLPYRLEFFGDDLESIRSFDPTTQLSVDNIKSISIIPNVQTKLLDEKRQSFLDFLPVNSKIWFKDFQQCKDTLDAYFDKANESFEDILKSGGNVKIVLKPEDLFEHSISFSELLEVFSLVEFGNIYYENPVETFKFESEPQPSFNKNFELLVERLQESQADGYTNIMLAESGKQLERLTTIFEELDPYLESNGLTIGLREGFTDKMNKLVCFTDHQLFERYHRYKLKDKFSKSKALTLKELNSLEPGDYVTHIDYGIGKFAGLDKVEVSGKHQEMLRLIYRDDDLLYVSIHSLHKISKYSGKEGNPPSISKLGTQEWEIKKKKAKKNVQDIAKDLISLYAKRKAANGFGFSADSFLQAELESSFIYEDTPDQAKATMAVKSDMEQPHPMDRLVCGDVGFGKTEVAIRAAMKACADGKQVAVLVPTTILALQHFHTFKERLSNLPVEVAYINRFKSTKEINETVKKLQEGKVNILIGTHKIVSKQVVFKDLGLLIIDEEQKFGVKVKEKIKEMKVNVDVLTLTATPIPRTLQFSLMGARDLSVIATAPPNRQPVTTEIHVANQELMRDAMSYELRRGGQVFYIHNRVLDIESQANLIMKLVPDARVGIAHGQMDGKKLEKVMVRFIEGDYDVLVSTNIVESGLDIPNANTIIINQAQNFGLSDLHQMRGRVGRSNKKAFCYLLTPPTIHLSSDARKRLSTLEEFSELGDGFKVAMRDLDIRGAGNLLGAEQSGFINDLGFETYHKILDETVQELKATEFRDLFINELKVDAQQFVTDCNIETDLEILIPEDYVTSISERLRLYSTLDNIKNEEELKNFIDSMVDRFGKYPEPVSDLIQSVRLRWLAEKLGAERLMLKNEVLKCYFPPSDTEVYYKSPAFDKVLQFVQKHQKRSKLKEYKKRLVLTVENVESIEAGFNILQAMEALK